MVYVLSAKRIPGTSYGKHLFKYDPFNQVAAFKWALEAGPTIERNGLVFGRNEQIIYVASWFTTFSSGTAVLTMLDINGNEFYSLGMSLAHHFLSVLIKYKNLGSEDMIVFTGGDNNI